jgi:anti-sigma regulatory factor (Ser/Thr protein kinase)
MVSFQADFATSDDILLEAASRRLSGHGSLIVEDVGRIGPIVEMSLAAIEHREQYSGILIEGEFAPKLRRALQTGRPCGGHFHAQAGAFPLGLENPVVASDMHWNQWCLHIENAAKARGFNPHLVAGLMGAMEEMQDNIYAHSGAPDTGVAAFAVSDVGFELVIADRGVGVLNTLRQNPAYADLPDSGAALQEAIKTGVSRFPSEEGRGRGFTQLYRTLVRDRSEIRFRSGDHSLTLRPGSDPMEGQAVLAQAAPLTGFAITVFCRCGD